MLLSMTVFSLLLVSWAFMVRGNGLQSFKSLLLLPSASINEPTETTFPLLSSADSASNLLDLIQSIPINKELSRKKVSIVSLIGFNNSNIHSRQLRDSIEESLRDSSISPDNLAILTTEIPSNTSWDDIRVYGGGDIAIVYVSSASKIADIDTPLWITQLQTLVDANKGRMKTPFSIILLLDAKLSEKEMLQAKRLANMVISTQCFSPKHASGYSHSKDIYLYTSSSSFDSKITLEEVQLSQKQWIRDILCQHLSQSLQLLLDMQSYKEVIQQHIKTRANKSQMQSNHSPPNAYDYQALNEAVSLTNHCLDMIQKALQPYTSSLDIYQSKWGNGNLFSSSPTFPDTVPQCVILVLQDISKRVMLTASEHHDVFSCEYDSLNKQAAPMSTVRDILIDKLKIFVGYMEKYMVTVLREEIQLEYEHQLQQLIRQTLNSANEGMITDGKELKRMLIKLRSLYLKQLQKICIYLHADFERMVFNASSLLTNDSSLNQKKEHILSFPCNFDTQHNHLSAAMQQLQEETLISLQLSGGINPYLRTHPFPPLHININYLVDPRGYEISREFDRLYDVHQDGVYAPKRAEAIIFPGMANIPFDPHERPMAKSSIRPDDGNLSPWQRLKAMATSFFADDDEEDNVDKINGQDITEMNVKDAGTADKKQISLLSWGEKKKNREVKTTHAETPPTEVVPPVAMAPTKDASSLSNRSFGRYGEMLRKKRLQELEEQQRNAAL